MIGSKRGALISSELSQAFDADVRGYGWSVGIVGAKHKISMEKNGWI